MRYLLFALLLSSCSAQWHLSKAISKDPAILLEPKIITLRDTVITQSVRNDTLLLPIHDTLTIEKERLRIQIKRVNDTIRITGECLTDTIEVVREVQLPPRIEYKERTPVWVGLLFGLFAIIALLGLGRYILDKYLSK